jgi:hypothetical protein
MLAFDVCNEGWRSKAMLDTVFEVARISTVDVAGSDRYWYYYAVSKRLRREFALPADDWVRMPTK